MKIVIVDDHAVVREGLKSALLQCDVDVVGEAKNFKEALAFIAHTHPDAVLVDINLPDGNGLEIVTWLRGISSTIGIVVLTMNTEDEFLIAAMKAGASAYISKSAPISEVYAALKLSIEAPENFTARGIREALERRKETFGLTPRELEVLTLLPEGKTASEIGASLYLSETTIKTYLANIYRKMDVPNRTAAITKARKTGLLK